MSDVQLSLLNILLCPRGINGLTLRAPWCHFEMMSKCDDKIFDQIHRFVIKHGGPSYHRPSRKIKLFNNRWRQPLGGTSHLPDHPRSNTGAAVHHAHTTNPSSILPYYALDARGLRGFTRFPNQLAAQDQPSSQGANLRRSCGS